MLVKYLVEDIDELLLNRMELFVREIIPELPKDHIKNNHLKNKSAEFYIYYKKDDIVAIISCSAHFIKLGESRRTSFVSCGGMAYKKQLPELRHITKKVSIQHLRFHLGRFWFLKSYYAVITTVSPRLYVQFIKFFDCISQSENIKQESKKGLKFQDLFHHFHHPKTHCGKFLISEHTLSERVDVTNVFDSQYQSKYEGINQLFFDAGIFTKDENKTYLHTKKMFIAGRYTFFGQCVKQLRKRKL